MLMRWQWQRLRDGRPPLPPLADLPVAVPTPALPHAAPGELRITWLGQSGFLIQIGERNFITDPVLSMRASPFASLGPARLAAPPFRVATLPRIDALIISHDHYDHLDTRTVRALLERFGADLPVFAPLRFTAWFAAAGARNVTELDWWQSAAFGHVELQCLPAQHWSRRRFAVNTRLWCSWLLRNSSHSVYFAGDSGYCPAFREIGARVGPPDIALMPIGAYEPRWFMKPAHMNPEEAVQSAVDLGARELVGMHWGTFHLTDEPLLEPPARVRTAWQKTGRAAELLHVPAHGETLVWPARTRSTT